MEENTTSNNPYIKAWEQRALLHSLQSDMTVDSQHTERFKGQLLLWVLVGALVGIVLAFWKHAYMGIV